MSYTTSNHAGRLDGRLNTTNYDHPQETNLLNIHRAMEYNSLGQPVLRTTSGASPTSNDAFGRLRTSNPLTLFDSFHRYNENQKFVYTTSGSGATSIDANSSMISNTVGTDSGAKVYRETTRVFAYQPGKSLQILQTFVFAPGKPNLRQRAGYFDSQNGVYLELNGTQLSFNIRSSTTGSIQYETVNQSDWNADPLDGTGISTRILDITKAQIMFIDIEWLGMGTVRCGFVIDGQFIITHSFHHANRISGTYMGTACLPVRFEIENVGTTSSSSTLYNVCTTVISEGGYELTGRPLSVGHTLQSPYTLSTSNVVYPVMSVRLKTTRPGAIVLPKNYNLGLSGNNNFRFLLILGGVTAGGSWISAGNNSSVEYNLTGTSIDMTNAIISEWRPIIGSNQFSGAGDMEAPFKYQLERNTFTGQSTELTMALATSGNNVGVYAAMNWEEFT